MSKHTPGPWKSDEDSVFTNQYVENGGDIVCLSPDCMNFPDSSVHWAANARLIAAAPELVGQHEANVADLLLLLKAIRAGDPLRELELRVDDLVRHSMDAIAKATGEGA